MGTRVQIVTGFFLAALASGPGCTKFDLGGIFIPAESANERFEDSRAWNEMNPYRTITVGEDNYSIFSVADLHVGTTNNLDKFNIIAQNSDPAAVVMAGDLTWGLEENFTALDEHLLRSETIPVFAIAGNHDCNFDGWKHFHKLFGSSTYFFKVETPVATDLFICLESAAATIGRKQMEWLTEILETVRPTCRRCIIHTHTNFFRFRFSEASNPNPEEIAAMLELMIKNRVDMVIAGHDHRKDEYVFGNITFIVIPPLKDGHNSAAYLKLMIKDGSPEYNFIPL